MINEMEELMKKINTLKFEKWETLDELTYYNELIRFGNECIQLIKICNLMLKKEIEKLEKRKDNN